MDKSKQLEIIESTQKAVEQIKKMISKNILMMHLNYFSAVAVRI